MRHYELVVVLSPMLNQEQLNETWDKIKGFITTRDAEISHEEQWGTRRLAYPIRKGQHRFLEGSYHLTRFATERAFNIELENFLKVDDEVLRSLVTTTLPEEELAAQAAAAARAIRTPPPRPAPVSPDGQTVSAEETTPAAGSTSESEVSAGSVEPQADSATQENPEVVSGSESSAEESEITEAAAEVSGSTGELGQESPPADEASPEEGEE